MRQYVCSIAVRLAASFSVVLTLVGSVAAQDNPSSGKKASTGERVFMQARCFACHGEYGFGGVGPRFREDRFLGLTDYVIGQILVGRGIMPSFADALNNNQIAAVASYIRSSWGNSFGDVQAQQVAGVREQVKLHPPQGRPHLQPSSAQPPGGAQPPQKPMPPGQALPPVQSNQ